MREMKEYQVKLREQTRNEQMLRRRSVSTARLHDTNPRNAILVESVFKITFLFRSIGTIDELRHIVVWFPDRGYAGVAGARSGPRQ